MKKFFIAAFVAIHSLIPAAISAQTIGPAPSIQVNLTASVAPTVSNDSTQGYAIGSVWQNASTGQTWIARSVAAGAAVWVPMTGAQGPIYVANNWYIPPGVQFAGTVTPNATTLYTFPFIAPQRFSIGACGGRVTTLQASQNFQCAIYANNSSTNRPTGAPLNKTADISTAATGAITAALGANVQIEAGKIYWMAYMGNSTTAIFYGTPAQATNYGVWIGSATAGNLVGNQVSINGLNVTGQTYGTWPDLTSASFSEVQATMPAIFFQVATVP